MLADARTGSATTACLSARLAAVGLAALLAAGCRSAPTASDWLAAGFRTPEQTFRTFQTAFAGDEPDLEYRCFSSGFRRRNGLTQIGYREARAHLLAGRHFLARLASTRIVATEELGPDRFRIDAEIDLLFGERLVRVELVREDFYELWNGDELVWDDWIDFDRAVGVLENGAAERGLAAVVPLPPPPPLPEEDAPESRVSELRVGREWKIDLIEDREPEPGSASP